MQTNIIDMHCIYTKHCMHDIDNYYFFRNAQYFCTMIDYVRRIGSYFICMWKKQKKCLHTLFCICTYFIFLSANNMCYKEVIQYLMMFNWKHLLKKMYLFLSDCFWNYKNRTFLVYYEVLNLLESKWLIYYITLCLYNRTMIVWFFFIAFCF